MGKRYRLNALKLDEISLVDKPAQEGARMVLFKRDNGTDRDDAPVECSKRGMLTSATDGHSHLLDDEAPGGAGHTSWEGEPNGHAHPFAIDAEGNVTIGESNGHTHDVAAVSKQHPSGDQPPLSTREENTMSQKTEKNEAARIEELEAENKTLKALSEMTDAEKVHYRKLDDASKAKFIAKSADERKAVIKAADDEDPIVHTCSDGTVFRKSDDPRLVAMAKRADEAETRAAKRDAELRAERLQKRAAEELGKLPQKDGGAAYVLKAIEDGDGTDAEKAAAMEMLKAANEAAAGNYNPVGTSNGGDDDSDPLAKLDRMANKRAEEKGITFAKAYEQVLLTEEGRALYTDSVSQ